MSLTILSVAYPQAPVRPDTAGGAEQVLGWMDEYLMSRGHRSIVLAMEGSRVRGLLAPCGRPAAQVDSATRHKAHAQYRAEVARLLKRFHVDLIHMHGFDFAAYLPHAAVPVLVTLHLPREMYPSDPLLVTRARTYFHCVSRTQQASWPSSARLLPVIENGVPLPPAPACSPRHGVAILGRICPEKGIHVALRAAIRAGVDCTLAGAVFPYPEHRAYFGSQVEPLLDGKRRYAGSLEPAERTRLLGSSQCVLIASTVQETSSLVAMEALSCGTPVVAIPSGALPEIVDHGRTGFLVRDEAEMAEAIVMAARIDPMECRKAAETRFSFERAGAEYLNLYKTLTRYSGAEPCDAHEEARCAS